MNREGTYFLHIGILGKNKFQVVPEGLGFSISSPLTRHDALSSVHTIELENNDDDAYVDDRVSVVVRQFDISNMTNLCNKFKFRNKRYDILSQ